MSGRLALVSLLILTGFVGASVLIAWLNPFSFSYFYAGARFANISGFFALFLIAGTGIMMVFRKPLLRFSKNPEGLRQLHVIVSALGGFFLIVHVAFFLLFPVTLPVLFGYVGTYAAFAIWVTGVIFIEGFRSSLFYHSLLSVIGVALHPDPCLRRRKGYSHAGVRTRPGRRSKRRTRGSTEGASRTASGTRSLKTAV